MAVERAGLRVARSSSREAHEGSRDAAVYPEHRSVVNRGVIHRRNGGQMFRNPNLLGWRKVFPEEKHIWLLVSH